MASEFVPRLSWPLNLMTSVHPSGEPSRRMVASEYPDMSNRARRDVKEQPTNGFQPMAQPTCCTHTIVARDNLPPDKELCPSTIPSRSYLSAITFQDEQASFV